MILSFFLAVVAHQGIHKSPLQRQVALLARHLRVHDGEDFVVAEYDSAVEPPSLVRFRRRRGRPLVPRGHVPAWRGRSAFLLPVGKGLCKINKN